MGSSTVVGADQLAELMQSAFDGFAEECVGEISSIMISGAELAELRLRNDNNRSEANKHPSVRSGEYSMSWTTDKTGRFAKGESSRKYGYASSGDLVIYNKKHYRLTHLLEKGAIRAKTGIVKGDAHISKTWEQVRQFLKTKGI